MVGHAVRQRVHPGGRGAGGAQHPRRHVLLAPGCPVAAGLPRPRHAGRRGRPRRHPVRQFRGGVSRRQHGAGSHPLRWRAAHAASGVPHRPVAGPQPRHGRCGRDRRHCRGGGGLCAGHDAAAGLPGRRQRGTDRCGRGVPAAALRWQRDRPPRERHARGRVRRQRSDRNLPHHRRSQSPQSSGPLADLGIRARVRAPDGRRCGDRRGRRLRAPRPHQPRRDRRRSLSDPGRGRRPPHLRRRTEPRCQRLPCHLSRRAHPRQPPAPRARVDQPVPRRAGVAGADPHVPDAGPPGDAARPARQPGRHRGSQPRAHPRGAAGRGRGQPHPVPLPLAREGVHRLGWPARRRADLPRHGAGARRSPARHPIFRHRVLRGAVLAADPGLDGGPGRAPPRSRAAAGPRSAGTPGDRAADLGRPRRGRLARGAREPRCCSPTRSCRCRRARASWR